MKAIARPRGDRNEQLDSALALFDPGDRFQAGCGYHCTEDTISVCFWSNKTEFVNLRLGRNMSCTEMLECIEVAFCQKLLEGE